MEKFWTYVSIIATLFTLIFSFWAVYYSTKSPGYLLISSSPTRAQILINGDKVGTTPIKVKLKPDFYTVTAILPNIEKSEQIIPVKPGTINPVLFTLPTNKIQDNVQTIEDKIKLENKLDEINQNMSSKNSSDVNLPHTTKDVQSMKIEFAELKKLVVENPEKTLSLPLIKKDIQQLQQEIKTLRDEINRVFDLSKWFIGTLIAMAIGLLGIVMTIIMSKPKDKDR